MSAEPTLPTPIAGYFQADHDLDFDALITWFADDATVIDNGESYRGHDAIREMFASSAAEFQAKTTVLTAEVDGPLVNVLTGVEGNFPGSPLELIYKFELKEGLIDTLNIELA